MNYPAPAPTYLGPPAHSSSGDNKPIRRIVLHGTVSPCVPGGARDIAKYFRSPSAGGSAHYVVDPVEVVQSAYDSVICWHAPPNGNSLGIEMCDPVGDAKGRPLPLSRWNDANHKAMLQLTARLVAELCLAYHIPARWVGPVALRAGKRGICEHSDVSAAFKQSSHWDLGAFPRRRFIRMVRAEIVAIKEATLTPAKAIAPKPAHPTRVDKARDLLTAAMTHAKSRVRKRKIQSCLDNLPRH